MSRQRRTFSTEEKQAILSEIERNGLSVTLRKHGLYARTIERWRRHVETSSTPAQADEVAAAQRELRRMQQENQQLKELVAEKELELRIKDSLLKKTLSRGRIE